MIQHLRTNVLCFTAAESLHLSPKIQTVADAQTQKINKPAMAPGEHKQMQGCFLLIGFSSFLWFTVFLTDEDL